MNSAIDLGISDNGFSSAVSGLLDFWLQFTPMIKI